MHIYKYENNKLKRKKFCFAVELQKNRNIN